MVEKESRPVTVQHFPPPPSKPPDPYHFSLLIAVNSEVNCYGYCVCVCAIPTPTTLLCDSTVLNCPVSVRDNCFFHSSQQYSRQIRSRITVVCAEVSVFMSCIFTFKHNLFQIVQTLKAQMRQKRTMWKLYQARHRRKMYLFSSSC